MKTYIHARLSNEDRAALEDLKKATGQSESEIVRRSIHALLADMRRLSALDRAGGSVGKFKNGPGDLSTNRKRLEGFGE